ncbi:MAG: alternative ribosome rescue aminoacyl-tRNA hydrolase ArfB [Bacteroidia bacterium]
MNLRETGIISECQLKAIRSGGKGGQHVNKVSTKMELAFDIAGSSVLDDETKSKLLTRLSGKISKDGLLRITEDSERSQHENRIKIIKKFLRLLENALKEKKKRKPTRVPKKAIEARKKEKSVRKERLQNRKPDY